jgi:uncharacterized protein YndB with AHSA1/START domain
MQEIHGTANGCVEAAAESVFRLITDIDRLPEWNDAIESVIEQPPQLTPGAEWVVKMHPNRAMSWKSRSSVQEIDRAALRFAYRTVNEDGNPSYTLWKWEIMPLDSGASVTVTWDVYLKTLDRRLLAGPIRKRQLRKEVAASLVAMEQAARKS